MTCYVCSTRSYVCCHSIQYQLSCCRFHQYPGFLRILQQQVLPVQAFHWLCPEQICTLLRWVDLSTCRRYLSWKEWCKSHITWRVYMFAAVNRVSLSSFLMFKLNNVSWRGTSNLLNTIQASKKCATLVPHHEIKWFGVISRKPMHWSKRSLFFTLLQNAWWWFSDSWEVS